MAKKLPKITDADSANLAMSVVSENLGRLVILSGMLEKKVNSLKTDLKRSEERCSDLARAIDLARQGEDFYDNY